MHLYQIRTFHDNKNQENSPNSFSGIYFTVWAGATKTSTDTTWKLKYLQEQKGKTPTPPPAWPKPLTVAQDGSGDYKPIQGAINAVRDLSQEKVTIYIKRGVYHKKVVVQPGRQKFHLLGKATPILLLPIKIIRVKIIRAAKTLSADTNTAHIHLILCWFRGMILGAENLSIENASGRVGQAVAFHAEGDRMVLKNCRLLGKQDTLYAATETSRQYYKDC